MKPYFYLAIFLLLPSLTDAQIIPLTNPSFEDSPMHSHVPVGWYDCGFPQESPPDVHLQPNSPFQVIKTSYDGGTYLGLVVRDNNTWEAIGQALPEKLEADSCYTLSMYTARSEIYVSSSRVTEEQANYNTPVLLRIYGGFFECDKAELLATSDLIVHTHWKELQLIFKPTDNYTHFIIEAFYKIPVIFPYNGNVLVDDLQLEKGCN